MLAPHALARLLGAYGSDQLELCEDAVQEALLNATQQWPRNPPDDPVAWVVTVARRRYVDLVRSDQRRREREARDADLAAPAAIEAGPTARDDDSLMLLQLCCHPDLSRSAQVALTLRAVAGLSTRQIANLYDAPEATVAQRITRAKRRIDELGHRLPRPNDRADRLGPVLNVLYLILTEAHHTTSGELVHDHALAGEAIRLGRLLLVAAPESTEVAGLLALMLLTDARQPARLTATGELVPLDEQDRTRWKRRQVDEALALVEKTVPVATPGPYLLQACVAALHAQAPSAEATDWGEILALYRVLEFITEHANPVIRLNRIVAQAMVDGEDAGLAELDALDADHPGTARTDAVRAYLLERLGQQAAAAHAFGRAAAATRSAAERRHLEQRQRRLRPG